MQKFEAFSSGYRIATQAGGPAAVIPFFKHAIELDPNFALSYALLGRVYGDIKDELRDCVSEREKYFITLSFQGVVSGDLEKAEQTGELWEQAYPRAFEPRDFLSEFIYPPLGQYEKVAYEAGEAAHLNPGFPISYNNLMFGYIALNRLDEAEAAYRQALEGKLDHPLFHVALYQIAFLQGDAARMSQHLTWSEGKPASKTGFWTWKRALPLIPGGFGRLGNFPAGRSIPLNARARRKRPLHILPSLDCGTLYSAIQTCEFRSTERCRPR
jgi:eukaryotic-like serine/threonine-protein kinase